MLVIGIAVIGVALAGCGSDSSSSATESSQEASTQAETTETTSSSDVSTEVFAPGVPTMEELFEQGTESPVPTSGPPPAKGKTVWWVSCGQSVPVCADSANAAAEAAKKLGINFHIADAKLGVGGGNISAFKTALATHPDAILVHGIACSSIQQPLREAKADGVPVMGVQTFDCNDGANGPELFTTAMEYNETAPSAVDFFTQFGEISAAYSINATEGKAKVLMNAGLEPQEKAVTAGFEAVLKKCAECEIVHTIEFENANAGPGGSWEQELRTGLLQYQEANVVFLPYDFNEVLGAPIVQSSLPSAIVVGGNSQGEDLDLVRQGVTQAVTAAYDGAWMGWGAMDNINRFLNGEKTVPEGVGFRVVDKDHNLPKAAGTPYQSPIDFEKAYEELWAGSK